MHLQSVVAIVLMTSLYTFVSCLYNDHYNDIVLKSQVEHVSFEYGITALVRAPTYTEASDAKRRKL